jgi:hypothetical protein
MFFTTFYCLRQKFINLWSLLITASLSEKVLIWTTYQWFHIVCKSWQYKVLHNGLTFCMCLDSAIFFQKDSHRMNVLTVQYYPQSFKIVSESWQYNFIQNGSTLCVCRDSIIKCTHEFALCVSRNNTKFDTTVSHRVWESWQYNVQPHDFNSCVTASVA